MPPRPKILHRDPPVDENVWKKFRSLAGNDGRIADPHGLKSLIFRGGIAPEMRPTIWKYMLGYYKWEWSDSENEKVCIIFFENYSMIYYRIERNWRKITTA